MVYIWFVVVGLLAGIFAGLLGIGGGIFYVPCFWYLLPKIGISGKLVARVSVATSLCIISFTAFFSLSVHVTRKALSFARIAVVLVSAFFGVFVGSVFLSSYVDIWLLKKLFAVFLMVVGFRMLAGGFIVRRYAIRHLYPFIGFLSGVLSSLLGIGGGIVANPLLLAFTDMETREVVAMGSLITFMNAFWGTLSYAFLNPPQGKWFLGFVYLPVLFFVLPSALLSSRFGAVLVYKVDHLIVRKIFGFLVIAAATKMIV